MRHLRDMLNLDVRLAASGKLQVTSFYALVRKCCLPEQSGLNKEQQAGPEHKTSVMLRDSRLPPTITASDCLWHICSMHVAVLLLADTRIPGVLSRVRETATCLMSYAFTTSF
jgi:hypothetical protein